MFSNNGHVMTLANSIIGVGILAMPFCFQKCGIILSIVLLILNYLVTRISCHYLIKSALITRRKSFELLAFHAFGSSGKLMVELCMIGYLIGSCITYFVVVGDLGPQIIAKIFEINQNDQLRTWIMIIITILCIIPLGLLKNVDSLATVCTASIGFYFCLVTKVISESATNILENNWQDKVEYWRPSGILQCLPIFSMALSCQMQLFEVVETIANQSLDKCNEIVKNATRICTCGYICVGLFGYIAFCNQTFSGNILINFSPSLASDAIKIGFVISVAFSFPLVIFPCRASLYSLLYRRGYSADTSGYIPDSRFKTITIGIVLTSLCLGILIPSIEIIIGLVGSTIGIAICVMFPALCFLKISSKESFEKTLAKIVLVSGFSLMMLGTYANLNAIDQRPIQKPQVTENILHIPLPTKKFVKEILKQYNSSEKKVFSNTVLPKQYDNNINSKKMNKLEEQQEAVVELPKIISKIEVAKNDPMIMKKSNVESNTSFINVKNDVNIINKDAIKKEEEITAEEKTENKLSSLQQAKNELKLTKELLSKKVDELKNELGKQNKETQSLMIEKLDNIAERVEVIERKVKDVNEVGEKKSTENILSNEQKYLRLPVEKHELGTQNLMVEKLDDIVERVEQIELYVKDVNEADILEINKQSKPIKILKSSNDPIAKYVDNGKKKTKFNNIQKPEQISENSLLNQKSKRMVQKSEINENDINKNKPLSYKAGEMLNNLTKANMNRTLPLLINSTVIRDIANSSKTLANEKTKKIEEKENVRAIRRDILEIKSTLHREKRNINQIEKKEVNNKCVINCVEEPNVDNMFVLNLSAEKLGIGRDLKAVKGKNRFYV